MTPIFFGMNKYCKISVVDPDPDSVGSGPFWSDQDPDPGLTKLHYINFLVCVKKYFKNLCCFTFWFINPVYFFQKNLFRSGLDPVEKVRIRSTGKKCWFMNKLFCKIKFPAKMY
jgi:hypothetical protein